MDPNVLNIEQNEQLDAQKNSQEENNHPYQQYDELYNLYFCEEDMDECSGDIILFV